MVLKCTGYFLFQIQTGNVISEIMDFLISIYGTVSTTLVQLLQQLHKQMLQIMHLI